MVIVPLVFDIVNDRCQVRPRSTVTLDTWRKDKCMARLLGNMLAGLSVDIGK
jgi:hypothetical protein